jgi:Rrf2 family protein
MKTNSQLSVTLHLLLHLADSASPVTSQALAGAMHTNPVVIRRMIGGLREAGLVHSSKGHNGGWSLARDLAEITLLDVYRALGSPRLLALGHRADNPDCLVEKAVNASLGDAFDAAEALLLARFGDVSLARLRGDVHAALGHVPTLCADGDAA